MNSNLTVPTDNSVENYITSVPDTKRRDDAIQLIEILKAATKDSPILWGTSIVGFGKYHYVYDSGREGDTVAVGFAARKPALALYGLFHYEDNEENTELAKQLGPHTSGKGCLYIKDLSTVNLDILNRMIVNAYTHRNNS